MRTIFKVIEFKAEFLKVYIPSEQQYIHIFVLNIPKDKLKNIKIALDNKEPEVWFFAKKELAKNFTTVYKIYDYEEIITSIPDL